MIECTIITTEPIFWYIFIGEFRNTRMLLVWFKNSKLSGLTCKGKASGKAGFPWFYLDACWRLRSCITIDWRIPTKFSGFDARSASLGTLALFPNSSRALVFGSGFPNSVLILLFFKNAWNIGDCGLDWTIRKQLIKWFFVS